METVSENCSGPGEWWGMEHQMDRGLVWGLAGIINSQYHGPRFLVQLQYRVPQIDFYPKP